MRTAILLTDRCIGSAVHGIIDALIATNYTLIKSGLDPMFDWDTISVDGNPITPTNGLTIHPDFSLEQYQKLAKKPDVWVFPPVFQSSSGYKKVERSIEKAQPIIPVIQSHHEKGGLILSICSGSFLLAEAGLLQNRPALMHWMSELHFRRMYPDLKIDTSNAIADYGNIISAIGGGMAYEHLVMHLVERYAGHRVAVDTAKLLMMNLNPPSPQPYRTNVETHQHNDALVLRAQRMIEKRSVAEVRFNELSELLSISERQLNRRFNKALDCTPLQYLQKIRINRACKLLELTHIPSNKIVYEIGYQDESSFRRLFKKQMDMTMETYRRQFGLFNEQSTEAI